MTATRILLAGGGTGGHVFPLVALAEAFRISAPDIELRFVGTEKGLEARVVRERGWVLDTLTIEPMKGRSFFGGARSSMVAGAAVFRAIALVARLRPKLVVSIGGYAAGPVSLAAAGMRVPVALLEPNRIAGLTQRLLAPIAKRIYVGFPEALGAAKGKGRALGIPLRPGFVPTPSRARASTDVLSVLVMGGSQGAEHLNKTVPAAMAKLAKHVVGSGASLTIVHQAGRGRADDVRAAYDQLGVRADVREFIDDVPRALIAADVVLARSGALTCAELCAIGRASVLIPYPYAADDHQASNAEGLQAAGAAIAIRQKAADGDAIFSALRTLADDDAKRVAMADAARARGVPDAAARIAADLLTLFSKSGGPS